MSLTWRFLLVILLLNFAVLGGVQTASYYVQQRWLTQQQQAYRGVQFSEILTGVYTPDGLQGNVDHVDQVRRLLRAKSVGGLFRDALVTNATDPRYPGFVHLNLRGAVHRDPDTFPREEILAGLERARNEVDPVPAGGGLCMAIRTGSQVVGSIWIVPREPPPAGLPLLVYAVAALLSTAVFGVLAYWTIRRTVVKPLARLGDAAGRVGAGDYQARVPELAGAIELKPLVDSFNAMTAKVAGHTEELEREVKAAVEETKDRERALVVSSRLAAMGTLAAGIAHEINNPIGGMLNAVHRLLQDPDLGEKERTYLQLVLDGLERVGHIARRVLDFSPRAIQAESFAVQSAVDGARALVNHRLRRQGVELSIDLADDLPELRGDPHEIQQVLLNLLLNSLDALSGAPGGHIEVAAARRGPWVEIAVADDGPGMDPQDLGQVMDPFFSGKDSPEATGLGMFISYSIIRNHGGEMELWASPGEGFRTTIRMPVPGTVPDP